jgi:hypothetical protein
VVNVDRAAEQPVKRVPLHKADAVHAVAAVEEAAVAAVAVNNTLPRQAPETSARCYTTGVGIWACCAAKRKSI